MGIVVSCANLATIYHNTKYSGGKVVNYLHISRKCSGCVRDVFGMHLERVRHLTICRTMNFLACLKSATQPFNVLLASKHPLITELSDKLRQKYPFLPTISPYPTMRLKAIRCMTRKYSSTRSEFLRFTKKNTIDLIFIMNYSRYSKELTIFA